MHFACIEYRIRDRIMYLNMREENVKILQILGWDGVLVLWSDMALMALRAPH